MDLFPDVPLEHLAGHGLPLVAHQVFQHVDLAGGQADLLPGAHGDAGAGVELEVAALEVAARGLVRPAQQRAAAGDQLANGFGR